MKTLKCRCGRDILVDDADYDKVKECSWDCTSGMHEYGVSGWSPLGCLIMGNFNKIVDHIDRDIHNNQRANLRFATRSENSHNIGVKTNNTTGFTGVKWVRSNNGYCVQVSKNKTRHHVGTFKSLRKAVEARNAKVKELYGSFAVLQEVPNE